MWLFMVDIRLSTVWLTARALLKNNRAFAKKYTQKKHLLFKVSCHECVRIELLLWLVCRVVLHAKRQWNVMHELSVERCPRFWRETSKHSVSYRGNAVMLYTKNEKSFIAVIYLCYMFKQYYTCGWTTRVVKLSLAKKFWLFFFLNLIIQPIIVYTMAFNRYVTDNKCHSEDQRSWNLDV